MQKQRQHGVCVQGEQHVCDRRESPQPVSVVSPQEVPQSQDEPRW